MATAPLEAGCSCLCCSTYTGDILPNMGAPECLPELITLEVWDYDLIASNNDFLGQVTLARDDLRDDLWNYITDMVHADKAAQ